MDVYQRNEILEDHEVWLQTNGQDGKRANFARASLDFVDLSKADLRKADFQGASLIQTDLSEAKLQESNLIAADLTDAILKKANLQRAELNSARLIKTNLTGADLRNANLKCAELIETNIMYANLSGCSVYGTSVWSLKINEKTMQSNLIITPNDEPTITVDDLQVAQFIYLLLHNEKIRNVIDTIGEKGVLILGRFTPERKVVLDAIRDSLRARGFLPMMFDFERPTQRDFSETIKILAGLSRFIIADITNPKSSPLELQATMPDYMIPFVPIIQENEEPFAMFRDLKQKYDEWVLDLLKYDSVENLLKVIHKAIILPALEKCQQLRIKKAEEIRSRHVHDYL